MPPERDNESLHPVHPAILARARELRRSLTPAEQQLWHRVRNKLLGVVIRRQHPIGRFIADFYCAEARLVIEIDGDTHATPHQVEYDAARTAWLESQGYRVIRFTNADIHTRMTSVLEAIGEASQIGRSPSPQPSPSGGGSGPSV